MKRRRSGNLQVLQNGERVGTLTRESSGAIHFQYDETWLANGAANPISLSLPLVESRYSGDAVVAVFDNLLPDSDHVRRQIAERTGADGRDPYSLLEAIGRDCVGALQFLTEGDMPDEPGTVKGQPLTDSDIAALLRDLHRTPLGLTTSSDFRFSVAGAQEKTALLLWKNRWHRPISTTATTHILKPQIGKLKNGLDLSQSVENEHFCLQLLKHLGLPVAESAIADFDDVRALSVTRFDRWWKDKHTLRRRPQEDCLQALGVPSARKYQAEGGPGIADVMRLLSASDRAGDDRKLFIKAQICFWLLAATDGHAKNFSIFLGPNGQFFMTPLYDVMSAQPLFALRQMRKNEMKLAMSFGRGRHYLVDRISRRHLYETAAACGMAESQVGEIINEVEAGWGQAVDVAYQAMAGYESGSVTGPIVDAASKRLKALRG